MKNILFLIIFCTSSYVFAVYENSDLLRKSSASIDRGLSFVEEKYYEFNFDGIFGITLAEAYLTKSLALTLPKKIKTNLYNLIEKCDNIKLKAAPLLPNKPQYMITFREKLLDSNIWSSSLAGNFTYGLIPNLGIYYNWTKDTVFKNKKAIYKNLKSDDCLIEILEKSGTKNEEPCFISPECNEMMLDTNRIDFGYLMTHRLLYLHIARLQGCSIPNSQNHANRICSFIYKETKTEEHLNYPYHDLFMEQVMLCGMEGYGEFFKKKWLLQMLNWQNSYGCYSSKATEGTKRRKRTSNMIDYGCSDHTTGLGIATNSLYFYYLLNLIYP